MVIDRHIISGGQTNYRRSFLRLLSSLGLVSLVGRAQACQPDSTEIEQPAERIDRAFIERAFAMRNHAKSLGDQAYGAVVVRNGKIVGQSWSRVVIDSDPTGHAEISALRDAARRYGAAVLQGATLYSSSRPCVMCEAAAGWVGIRSMVHGREAHNAGTPGRCS